MADIFVSYASADRDRARQVAQALSDQGWAVWWDRTIPPGRQFDEVIEEALDSARCVIVLWSKASVASQWVKTEAAEAMRRKILVPVLIEDVKIPLEFRRLQAADLSTWKGERAHEELQKFFASIEVNVGKAGGAPAAAPESQAPAPSPPAVQPAIPVPARQEPAPVRLEPEPTVYVPAPAAKPTSKLLLAGAAGLAAIVVVAVGYTAYAERARRVAMEERAERERKAAEEARIKAEQAAAAAKLAQEEAAREAARRKAADDQRRAAEEQRRAAEVASAARVKALQEEARAKAAQEEAARARAVQEAAARGRAEEMARAKAAADDARKQQVAAAAANRTTSMRISWYDNALRFNGTLTGNPTSATLRAAVYDLKTGALIGTYDVPAAVTKQGDSEFIVSGTFSVPKDSQTPYPHTHTSRLVLRRQSDGSLRYIENCPRAGQQCYR